MKKIIFLAAAASLLLTASCSDEQLFSEGKGKVVISTTLSTDMAVVSRSLQDDYAESTVIWISDTRGPIRQYNSLSELPAEPLILRAGNYTAEGWCGDSVAASFDKRWYKAAVPFTITDGQVTQVPLTLKISNVAVSVQYDESVAEVLRDCKMTVGHTGGSLVYEGETSASRGYFMFPQSSDRALNYKLEASQLGGTPFEVSGIIENTKPGTEYILHVVYDPVNPEMGAGYFTITIDQRPIPVQREDIELITPPVFKGYGFNLTETISGEHGTIGRRCIYVTSASRIDRVLIESDALTAIVGGPDVELFGMAESVRSTLASAGINYVDGYYNEAEDNTLLQINFEEDFTDNLTNGLYTFSFTATDREGRTGHATMTINVSNAPVETEPIAEGDLSVYTNRATLKATVLKDDAAEYGFKYRSTGAARATGLWETVAVTPVDGVMTLELTGLTPGTNYEYCAYADSFEGSICTFATEAAAQLPNSGFEEWDTSSKTYLIMAPGGEMFWDSGNHGATTMGSSITTPDNTLKHSGEYSAKLYSKFIGIGTIGKFAAGNLFAGKYLATVGTDGVLGWGRPFTSRPSAVKVWVKYVPQAAQGKGAGSLLPAGTMDQGIVYCALTDATTQTYNDKGAWPVVVKTGANSQLFDPEADQVIAYGQHVFDGATDGSELIEFTIPLDYKRTDIRPSYIVMVCSASRYGDYFQGGEGSTMWVDDIQLIYE